MYCAQRIIHFRPRVSAHAFSARARLLAGPPRRPSLQLRAWTKLSSQVLGMVVRVCVCVYIYIYLCDVQCQRFGALLLSRGWALPVSQLAVTSAGWACRAARFDTCLQSCSRALLAELLCYGLVFPGARSICAHLHHHLPGQLWSLPGPPLEGHGQNLLLRVSPREL